MPPNMHIKSKISLVFNLTTMSFAEAVLTTTGGQHPLDPINRYVLAKVLSVKPAPPSANLVRILALYHTHLELYNVLEVTCPLTRKTMWRTVMEGHTVQGLMETTTHTGGQGVLLTHTHHGHPYILWKTRRYLTSGWQSLTTLTQGSYRPGLVGWLRLVPPGYPTPAWQTPPPIIKRPRPPHRPPIQTRRRRHTRRKTVRFASPLEIPETF